MAIGYALYMNATDRVKLNRFSSAMVWSISSG